jgi:hypothetical protein
MIFFKFYQIRQPGYFSMDNFIFYHNLNRLAFLASAEFVPQAFL